MNSAEKLEFRQAIYDIVAAIPQGKVSTYGEIARLAGFPRYHRLAAKALQEPSAPDALPCHHVVNSQGRTAPLWPEQRQLLRAENVAFRPNGMVDMTRHRWDPNDLLNEPM